MHQSMVVLDRVNVFTMYQFYMLVTLDNILMAIANPPSAIIRILGSRSALHMEYVVAYIGVLRYSSGVFVFTTREDLAGLSFDVKLALLVVGFAFALLECLVHIFFFAKKLTRYEDEQIMSKFIDVKYLWTVENETEVADLAERLGRHLRSLPLEALQKASRKSCCCAYLKINDGDDDDELENIHTRNKLLCPEQQQQRNTEEASGTCVEITDIDEPDSICSVEAANNTVVEVKPPVNPDAPDMQITRESISTFDAFRIGVASIQLWEASKGISWCLAVLAAAVQGFEAFVWTMADRKLINYSHQLVLLCVYPIGLLFNHFIIRKWKPYIRCMIITYMQLASNIRLLVVFKTKHKINPYYDIAFAVLNPIILVNIFELFFANLRHYVQPNYKISFRIQKFIIFYGMHIYGLLFGVLLFQNFEPTGLITLVGNFTILFCLYYIRRPSRKPLLDLMYRSTNINFLLID